MKLLLWLQLVILMNLISSLHLVTLKTGWACLLVEINQLHALM